MGRPVKQIDILSIAGEKSKEDEDDIKKQFYLINIIKVGSWRLWFPIWHFFDHGVC